MELEVYDEVVFEKLDYAEKLIKRREFQSCTFIKCDFANCDFSDTKFLECTFNDCNLAMAKLKNVTLSNVVFDGCKLLGINFSECQEFLFSVGFDSCILDYASFMGRKLLKTKFSKTSLKEVNFSLANLSGSSFDQADLSGALFNQTDLSAVNFITATNYSIDPEINNLKKASFSLQNIYGLLSKYNIKIVP